MKKNIGENFKKLVIGVVLIVIVFGFIGTIKSARAMDIPEVAQLRPDPNSLTGYSYGTDIGNVLSNLLYKTMSGVAYAFAYVGGKILSLESKLLAWVVDISVFTKLPVVQTGWKIVRDFTNLFFIAILIYAAFATILKLGKGNQQALVFRVVLMAVLINFSLMIGGMIIDFSQVMFKYFIFANLTEKTGTELGNKFADALKVQTFLSNSKSQTDLVKETGASDETSAGFLSMFGKLIFIVIFTFLVVICWGAIILTLFVRNFWLWILLILAPIAWFLGILPSQMSFLSKYGKEWWTHFLKWCFVAPIMGFFMFLALTITMGKDSDSGTIGTLVNKKELEASWGKDDPMLSGSTASIFNPSNILQMGIVLAFLMGGLMAGQSLGSKAAGGALKFAKKTGTNVQKGLRRKGADAFNRGAGNVAGRAMDSKAFQKISSIPLIGSGLGTLGRKLENKGTTAHDAAIKKADKNLGSRSLGQLNDSFGSLTRKQQEAAIQRAMKEGKMPKNMQDMAMKLAAKGTIDEKALLKVNPTLRQGWRDSTDDIKKLEYERGVIERDSDSSDKAQKLEAKDMEIKRAKTALENQVAKDVTTETDKEGNVKNKNSVEIAKAFSAISNLEKIPETLAESVVKAMAASSDSAMLMSAINQITDVSRRANMVESIVREKMNSDSSLAGKSDAEKFAALNDFSHKDYRFMRRVKNDYVLQQLGVFDELRDQTIGIIDSRKSPGQIKEIFSSSEDADLPKQSTSLASEIEEVKNQLKNVADRPDSPEKIEEMRKLNVNIENMEARLHSGLDSSDIAYQAQANVNLSKKLDELSRQEKAREALMTEKNKDLKNEIKNMDEKRNR